MPPSNLDIKQMRVLRSPELALKLRKMFKDSPECIAAHPKQANRYNRPFPLGIRSVLSVAATEDLHGLVVMEDDAAIGMATVIPNLTIRSGATVVRGTELDYWLTPERDSDSIHRNVARRVLSYGRAVARYHNYHSYRDISIEERVKKFNSSETTGFPNACVFAFVADPAAAANRGLSYVLQPHRDQSEFRVVGSDPFEIAVTTHAAQVYTGPLTGTDLRLVS